MPDRVAMISSDVTICRRVDKVFCAQAGSVLLGLLPVVAACLLLRIATTAATGDPMRVRNGVTLSRTMAAALIRSAQRLEGDVTSAAASNAVQLCPSHTLVVTTSPPHVARLIVG